jgi:hypothetical protein
VARTAKTIRWTRHAFLKALEELPPGLYQERWIKWVSNYNRGRKRKNASAKTIYNRVQQPSWILWLAEAGGIDKASIRDAKKRAAGHDKNQTRTKEMRVTLSWARIAGQLEQIPSRKHLTEYHTTTGLGGKEPTKNKQERNSSSAASDSYSRYVETYEVEISPAHNTLQKRFERFLSRDGATELKPNVDGVDLRYQDETKGTILVEIKPCERASARYAIRTAIGQLLDYEQRVKKHASLLIVVGTKPLEEDRLLATSNGFGIAYPAKGLFEVLWPTLRTR